MHECIAIWRLAAALGGFAAGRLSRGGVADGACVAFYGANRRACRAGAVSDNFTLSDTLPPHESTKARKHASRRAAADKPGSSAPAACSA